MGVLHLSLGVLILALSYASTQDLDCDFSQTIKPDITYYVRNKEYPYNYRPGVTCRWIVECPTGYNCVLNCDPIELPYTPSCSIDRLLISTSGDPQLAGADYYCGRGTVRAVSTGTILSVALISSLDSPGGRFSCSLKAQLASAPPPTCSCGYSRKMRIVGGVETGVNEYPSMAGIVLDVALGQIQCGATIIAERYVVTAAHCVENRIASNLAVVVGEHNVTIGDSPATTAYRVERIIPHPRFNPTTFDYDIAILRTTQAMTFGPLVGPVCLPFKFVNVDVTGATVTALGWGTLSIGGEKSDVLRKVDLDVISPTVCRRAVPTLTPRQMCTYTSGKDACQDDSGGPLLYTEPSTNLLYIFGVISYGQLCAIEGNPGVNTKVVEFLSWIQSNTPDATYCKK